MKAFKLNYNRSNTFKLIDGKRFFFLMFIGLIGCSGGNRQLSLQYNLKEGSNYRQRTITEQTVKQEFQGEIQTVTNRVNSVINYKIIENDGKNTRIQVSYDTMDIVIQLPDRQMHFSSKGSFWKKEDLFSQLLNDMSGKHFTIVIENNSGKIQSIEGLEELFQEVLVKFSTANDEQFSSIMEMLNKSYGENAFKDSFEATNAYLTENKLKKGDQWEVKSSLTNVDVVINTTWEIKDIQKDGAILTGKGVVQMKDGNRATEVEGVTTQLNLTGTQTSNLTINPNTAWPISGKVKQSLKGVMNLKEVASGQTASLPLEMTNVITYTSLE